MIANCGHPIASDGIATGFATDRNDYTMCYRCADESERFELSRACGPFVGYVSQDGRTFQTWSGGVLGAIVWHKQGGDRWRPIHSYNVRTDDGREWYGRNAGWASGEGCLLVIRPRKVGA